MGAGVRFPSILEIQFGISPLQLKRKGVIKRMRRAMTARLIAVLRILIRDYQVPCLLAPATLQPLALAALVMSQVRDTVPSA